VAFPWASHVRGLFPVRCDPGSPIAAFGVREGFGTAEGGRFCDGTFWDGTFCRSDGADEFGIAEGGRFCDGPFPDGTFCRGDGADEFGIAEGGRFCDGPFSDGTFCRSDGADEFGIAVARPFIVGAFCLGAFSAGAFGVPVRWFIAPFAGRFPGLFTGESPMRPEVSPVLLTVRTGIWEAPCAGAVRATTVRF
jgi:hypothetical protein